MTSDDSAQTTTPEEHAEELGRLFKNHKGVNSVTESADDDGAAVTCYVFTDYTDEIETLAGNSGFDLVHTHAVGDEVYYVFGYEPE